LAILALMVIPQARTEAQDPVSLIIKQGITKVIQAVDLKIQRLQTKTIWLQNAQKLIENSMTKSQLDAITGWVEKQRLLYKDYFEELSKVKSVLSYYYKVKEISELQLSLVKAYKQGLRAVGSDRHFSAGEVTYMASVYSGIIDESLKNLDRLSLAINAFTTQMSDEKRMEIIESVRSAIQKNYDDLKRFSTQNIRLSISRAKDENEISLVKKLYGLQ